MTDKRREFPFLPVFLVGGVALFAFYQARAALTPFLLAATFAYVLNPVVSYFEAHGLRRFHLVLCGYLAALALAAVAYAGLKSVLLEETERFQTRAPAYFQQFQRAAYAKQAMLSKNLPLPPKIAANALDSALSGALNTLRELPSHILALLPLFAHALLVPFIGFFFLLDGPGGVDRIIQTCPSRLVEQAIHLLSEIDMALGNYLRGLIIVVTIIFILSFLGLIALGVDNALIIAAISALSSVVP